MSRLRGSALGAGLAGVTLLLGGVSVPAYGEESTHGVVADWQGAHGSAVKSTSQASSVTAAKKKVKRVDARKLLKKVSKKAERSGSSYRRSAFKHWVDADRDGCHTRNEVLIAESREQVRTGSRCAVLSGEWLSYYDNKVMTNPSGLDIDHMVPLKEAWESGAYRWNDSTRERFANDLKYGPSLVAVTASTNRSKADRDPASWLPANNKCRYVSEWVAVKWRWKLSADASEKRAVRKVLNSCKKSERMVEKPKRGKVVIAKTPPKKEKPKKDEEKPRGDTKVYANCDALRKVYIGGVARDHKAVDSHAQALRYAPRVDKALYEANASKDRDKDGIACEVSR